MWNRLRPAVLLLPYAVLVWLVWGLIVGEETLFFRDVFNLHWPAKLAQVRDWSAARLPFVDPFRAGGQPGLGNPNTLPLYPSNLLYLVAPHLWAFNAHLWLHLLIAPWSFYWLGRRFELSPMASWSAAVIYGASGYVLSQMSFYNLMPGVALAPALIASALLVRDRAHPTPSTPGRSRGGLGWAVAAFAALWALLLLGGEPVIAAASFGLAVLAVAVARSLVPFRRSVPALVLGSVAGALFALPQYVELFRILASSYRGFQGFSEASRLFASWDPRRILDWFLPLPYGEPLLTFWGRDFFGGDLPLFWSLYPGVLALGLIAYSGLPRTPLHRFAWISIAFGMFMALGRYNPMFGLVLELPGAGLVRFPIKFFLPVALGASCLTGAAIDRFLGDSDARPMLRVLGLLALGYLVAAAVLSSFGDGVERWLASHIPPEFPGSLAESIRIRWLLLAVTSAGIALAYAGFLWFGRKRLQRAVVACLVLHALLQAWLIGSLVMTDQVEAYRGEPPLVASIGADETIAHGNSSELFGVPALPEGFPDPRLFWVQRRGWEELYPFAGVWAGRRYELNVSAEGLDSYLSQVTLKAMNGLDDSARLQVLRGLGVGVLVLGRELDSEALSGVRLRTLHRSRFGPVRVYEIEGHAEQVQRVPDIHRAANLNQTLETLASPGFDSRVSVVLGGEGPRRQGAPGELEVLSRSPRLVVRTRGPTAAAIVVHRSHLPLYRASVDGRSAPIAVANMTHMAVEVPPGEHQVELWVERRPFFWSLAAWPLALVLLGLFIVRERRV